MEQEERRQLARLQPRGREHPRPGGAEEADDEAAAERLDHHPRVTDARIEREMAGEKQRPHRDARDAEQRGAEEKQAIGLAAEPDERAGGGTRPALGVFAGWETHGAVDVHPDQRLRGVRPCLAGEPPHAGQPSRHNNRKLSHQAGLR